MGYTTIKELKANCKHPNKEKVETKTSGDFTYEDYEVETTVYYCPDCEETIEEERRLHWTHGM